MKKRNTLCLYCQNKYIVYNNDYCSIECGQLARDAGESK